jgi:hypothetical protein
MICLFLYEKLLDVWCNEILDLYMRILQHIKTFRKKAQPNPYIIFLL